MRRRSFLAAAAGVSFLRPAPAAKGVVERRTYRDCAPGFREALERCLRQAGIDAQPSGFTGDSVTYICRFAAIAGRNAAWDRVSTLPAWPAVSRGFGGYRFDLHS